jgi:hypothetical protein
MYCCMGEKSQKHNKIKIIDLVEVHYIILITLNFFFISKNLLKADSFFKDN